MDLEKKFLNKNISKKRTIKLLMSGGISRNHANEIATAIPIFFGKRTEEIVRRYIEFNKRTNALIKAFAELGEQACQKDERLNRIIDKER